MDCGEFEGERLEYNYVKIGTDFNKVLSVVKGIAIDYSQPVTRERCKKIAEKLQATCIELNHSIFVWIGISWGGYEKRLDKRYTYNAKSDELIIYDDNMPIYSNTSGNICKDQAALCDSLFD